MDNRYRSTPRQAVSLPATLPQAVFPTDEDFLRLFLTCLSRKIVPVVCWCLKHKMQPAHSQCICNVNQPDLPQGRGDICLSPVTDPTQLALVSRGKMQQHTNLTAAEQDGRKLNTAVSLRPQGLCFDAVFDGLLPAQSAGV